MGSLLTDPRRDRGGIVAGGAQALGDQRHDQCCGANGGERHEHRARHCGNGICAVSDVEHPIAALDVFRVLQLTDGAVYDLARCGRDRSTEPLPDNTDVTMERLRDPRCESRPQIAFVEHEGPQQMLLRVLREERGFR